MSIIRKSFYKGLNLGGWFSQCKEYTQENYNTFIVEEDFKQIKALGFDHVRVPFDYHLILEDDYKTYIESGFDHINRAISWCEKYGLNMVLDLHKAPGYSFDTKDDNQLFSDPALQEVAVDIWRTLARKYSGQYEQEIIFELLNEIVEPDSSRWNILATKMVKVIRENDCERTIMIGGNNYNSCGDLKYIPKFEDDKIVYTFHFYDPILFTHQKAYWAAKNMAYNQSLAYPGDYTNYEEFAKNYPQYYDEGLLEEGLNKEAIRKYLQPAVTFIEENDVPLYCGEYGVIALASLESRINWHRDFMSLLDELEIGSGCWSYKEMDFELIDDQGQPLSMELMNILNRTQVSKA